MYIYMYVSHIMYDLMCPILADLFQNSSVSGYNCTPPKHSNLANCNQRYLDSSR